MVMRTLGVAWAVAALIATGCDKKDQQAPAPAGEGDEAAQVEGEGAAEGPAEAEDEGAEQAATAGEGEDEGAAGADEGAEAGDDEAGDDEAAADGDADAAAESRAARSIAAFEAGAELDYDAALADFAPDGVWHMIGLPPVEGKDAVKEVWSANAPKDPHMHLERVFVADDVVGLQYVSMATEPTSGEEVGTYGFMTMAWEGDHLVEVVAYENGITLMQQAGLIPAENPPPIPEAPTSYDVVEAPPNADHVALIERSWDPETTDEEHMKMMTEVIAEDIVLHVRADHKTLESRQALIEEMQVWMSAFPDAEPELVAAFGVGDYVIARGRMSGTHEGDLPFAEATGKPTTTDIATIMRFEDGQVVEQWEYWNGVQLATQIGLLPVGGAAAKPDGDAAEDTGEGAGGAEAAGEDTDEGAGGAEAAGEDTGDGADGAEAAGEDTGDGAGGAEAAGEDTGDGADGAEPAADAEGQAPSADDDEE